jgi:hypothetical protein
MINVMVFITVELNLCMIHQVISVGLQFGDEYYQFQSSFSSEDSQQALYIAVSIARASADSKAMVHINGILTHREIIHLVSGGFTVPMGQTLMSQNEEVSPAPHVGVTTVSSDLDHFVNMLIEENPESFAFNKGLWNTTMD